MVSLTDTNANNKNFTAAVENARKCSIGSLSHIQSMVVFDEPIITNLSCWDIKLLLHGRKKLFKDMITSD